jgi:hypothetical protein
MDYGTIVAIALTVFLLYFSLDFNKGYCSGFNDAALHPAARFFAGLALAYIAEKHQLLASVLLVVIFFWIADVSLLSAFPL